MKLEAVYSFGRWLGNGLGTPIHDIKESDALGGIVSSTSCHLQDFHRFINTTDSVAAILELL